MFGLDPLVLGFAAISALAVGGLLYALFFSSIEDEQKRAQRMGAITRGGPKTTGNKHADNEKNERRRKISQALSDIDDKNQERDKKVTKPPIRLMLRQSGLKISIRQFYMLSAGAGALFFILPMLLQYPIYISLGAAFVGAFGVPRWVVGYMRKRRMNAFIDEFPNAIDVIVRAIRSGLPLNDGLKLIATEAREPVKQEFQRISERQAFGMSTSDACLRMYETMPVSEANFFGVVIQIQSQAGGNLGEALGNLSGVLRARKSMKGKIGAMSMEAKASAYIIGSLPFLVAGLVHLTSPDYLQPLFTTDTGKLILGCSAVWMSIGIFVMRNMINFEF